MEKLTPELVETTFNICALFWAFKQFFLILEQIIEWGVSWLKRIRTGEAEIMNNNLSVNDVELLCVALNNHMKTLDQTNGPGTSLNSPYWPLMLKLKKYQLHKKSKKGEIDE